MYGKAVEQNVYYRHKNFSSLNMLLMTNKQQLILAVRVPPMFCICTNTWHCGKFGIFVNTVGRRWVFSMILVFFIAIKVDGNFMFIAYFTYVIPYNIFIFCLITNKLYFYYNFYWGLFINHNISCVWALCDYCHLFWWTETCNLNLLYGNLNVV